MLCSCRNPLFWGRGSVTQGQGNRHVWLCQPAEAGCRFSEELSSECSWCEENAQGAKAAWGWRKREPGPRSCLGEWDGVRWSLVLGICCYLGSGAAALNVTQGHRNSPESAAPDPSTLVNPLLLLHMWCSVGHLLDWEERVICSRGAL